MWTILFIVLMYTANLLPYGISLNFMVHAFRINDFWVRKRLGFTYWYNKQMVYPFVRGRARDLYKTLCHNLGIIVKVNKTSSKTKAYNALGKLIAQNIPVMIHVDMPFLKYPVRAIRNLGTKEFTFR